MRWVKSRGLNMSAYFRKVRDSVNVLPLSNSLKRQPELFGKYNFRRIAPNTPHADMTDIYLRYRDDLEELMASGSMAKAGDPHRSVWMPCHEALPQATPIVFDLMRLVCGEELGGILITKLPPGGKIKPHVDLGWHARSYEKYVVSIEQSAGAVFKFPDGEFEAMPGDIHWFDNSVLHSVENNSNTDRVVMIIAIRHNRDLL